MITDLRKDWKYIEDRFHFRNIGTDDDPIFEPVNIWHVDTSYITEVGTYFTKHKRYEYRIPTDEIKRARWMERLINRDLPPDEMFYWLREKERIEQGLLLKGQYVNGEVKDIHVSGNLYFKLNYCPIQKLTYRDDGTEYKDAGMSDFWHWHYMYDNLKQLAKFLHLNTIIVKSRQVGMSIDLAADMAYGMYAIEGFRGIIAAYDSTWLQDDDKGGTLDKLDLIVGHVNTNTAFWMEILTNNSDGISFGNKSNKATKFISGVTALTFAKKAGKGVGKTVDRIGVEEFGEFESPLDMYTMMNPTTMSGTVRTALMSFQGTAGHNAKAQRDMLAICDNPRIIDAVVLSDWLRKKPRPRGYAFFYGRQMNLYPQFTDKDGNSDDAGALKYIEEVEVPNKEKNLDSEKLAAYKAQYPTSPDQLVVKGSGFGLLPTDLIDFQIERIKSNPDVTKNIRYGTFKRLGDGTVHFIDNESLDASDRHVFLNENAIKEIKDFTGCWQLSKDRVQVNGVTPYYSHLGAYDPYGIDKIKNKLSGRDSLGAIIIGEVLVAGYNSGPEFNAMWLGRPGDVDIADAQAWLACCYFNLFRNPKDIMTPGGMFLFENNRSQVFPNFKQWKATEALMRQPQNRNKGDNYTVSQEYGMTITPALKTNGVGMVGKLFKTAIGINEFGSIIYTINTFYAMGTLERLSSFDGDLEKNFDGLSAFIIYAYAYAEYLIQNEDRTKKAIAEHNYYDEPDVFDNVSDFAGLVKRRLQQYGSSTRDTSQEVKLQSGYYDD